MVIYKAIHKSVANFCDLKMKSSKFLRTQNSYTISNSHYEINFGFCCAEGAAKPKIGFVESPPNADFQQNQFL